MKHRISVSEPYFTLIDRKLKTVEGRLNKGKFKDLKKEDIVTWYHEQDDKVRECDTVITNIRHYKSFEEYLKRETLKKTLPGIPSIECGVAVYRQFYNKNKENEFGILAIELKKI